ncbi:PepSY domain-containing protein [Alkaliphilus serpentinus]|uniref:YcdB/YcdC repeated domain-containing protein n=1 Tax=Alkaliphilus serpentinus TaxID=1482731 RepID=A0A833M874_9FIRM|nr:PepSY domain-containing protein [Alkaliphilus serpentinus]KAB3532098.1 hypothetical protein F8153_03245 [Alkaliphilus serpentinus]
MTKIIRFIIIIILLLSLSLNAIYYFQLKEARDKLTDTNQLVSAQVERNIRQTMLHIRDLKESKSLISLQSLQGSVQELVVSFSHWVALNQSIENPNEELAKGLSGIEALRNTMINYLNTQFIVNENTLNEFDIEMLDKAHENFDRFSLVFTKLKEQPGDKGKESIMNLVQWAGNVEEMSRLYRHSVIPNKHPHYISEEKATASLLKAYPDFEVEDADISPPNYRDGLHYYQFTIEDNKEIKHIVWVDALNGAIRNFEDRSTGGKKSLSQENALELAREYLKGFYKYDVLEEIFNLKIEDEKKTIYSFRFTPIDKDIKMVSDAYTINIDSRSGEVIKYSNDYSRTITPSFDDVVNVEDIIATYTKEYGSLQYDGLSVIRTFETRYKPRLTHSFKVDQNQQQIIVYFDALTGKQIYQLYYIYKPVNQNEED